VWRAVVIGEIKVRDTAIEGAADHGAASFENIGAAEVLPQAKRDGRKHKAGVAAAAEDGVVVASGVGNVGGFHKSPHTRIAPTSMPPGPRVIPSCELRVAQTSGKGSPRAGRRHHRSRVTVGRRPSARLAGALRRGAS